MKSSMQLRGMVMLGRFYTIFFSKKDLLGLPVCSNLQTPLPKLDLYKKRICFSESKFFLFRVGSPSGPSLSIQSGPLFQREADICLKEFPPLQVHPLILNQVDQIFQKLGSMNHHKECTYQVLGFHSSVWMTILTC